MADLNVSLIIRAIDRATGPIRAVTRNFSAMRQAKIAADQQFARAASVRQAAEGMRQFSDVALRAVRAPIREFEDFEFAMSAVEAKTKNLREGELEMLTTTAKHLGATTKFTAEEAARGFELLAQAGFDATEQLETLPTVLNLSTASGVETARTSEVLADLIGAFGKETGQATEVADVLAATMTNSNTTLETLYETMKLAGPQATDLGVSLEDVATMAGIMGSAGIKGSLAGTAMRAALTRLVKPSGQAREILERLGIKVGDAEGNFRGLVPIMDEVGKKTQHLGSVARGAIFAELFGVRGLAGASNIIRGIQTGKFNELATAVTNAGGSTQRMADIMMRNARGATIRLTSAFSGMLTAIGEKLAPTLTSLKNTLTSVIQWITAWVNRNPRLAKALALATAAFAALTAALTAATFALATLGAASAMTNLGLGALKTGTQIAVGGFNKLRLAILASQSTIVSFETMPARQGMFAMTKAVLAAIPAFIGLKVSSIAAAIGVNAALWPVLAIAAAIATLVAGVYFALKYWDDLVAIWERFKNASIQTKIALGLILAPLVVLLSPFIAIAGIIKWFQTGGASALNALVAPLVLVKDAIVDIWEWLNKIEVPDWLASFGQMHVELLSRAGEAVANVARESAYVLGGPEAATPESAIGAANGGAATGLMEIKITTDAGTKATVEKQESRNMETVVETGENLAPAY